MRLISFALATSTAILTRDTNASRTRGSTVTSASLPAIFRSSVGTHNDVVVKRLLKAREKIAADEERMPISVDTVIHRVIGGLFTKLRLVEKYPPNLGEEIKDKLIAFDRDAIEHYFKKEYVDPIMALKKLKEVCIVEHNQMHGSLDMKTYRDSYHDHLQKEIWASQDVKELYNNVELHPTAVFTMMINAGKCPVVGVDSRNLFATTNLEALSAYIQRFNEKVKPPFPVSLQNTLSYCIHDDVGLASFLSIAKQNSINAPFVWNEQQSLFTGWMGQGKTIDQVANMMRIPGQWKDAKAYPFLDTLTGYVMVHAQANPAGSIYTVSCLVNKFGHLYTAMLIGAGKEVNIGVFNKLEKALFRSWTNGEINPLNVKQAVFFTESTVDADDKASICEHFAEHYRQETPSHLMLMLN